MGRMKWIKEARIMGRMKWITESPDYGAYEVD